MKESDVVGKVVHVGPWEETSVYRYLPVERFLEIVENKQNTLAHISKWEDPNEAYPIKAMIEANDIGDERVKELYDRYRTFYGQSWTFNSEESDVLWRAYGKRGDTVRLETSLKMLEGTVRGIVEAKDTGYEVSAYVGPVSYVNDIREVLRLRGDDAVKALFVKRREFAAENEFRIVVKVDDAEENGEKDGQRIQTVGGLLRFKVAVPELIRSVLVDPCCTFDRMDEIYCRVMNAGFDININRSKLFERPRLVLPSVHAAVTHAPTIGSDDDQGELSLEAEFWRGFAREYRGGKSEFAGRTPSTRRYWGFPIGNGMSYFVTLNRSCARVELYIDSQNTEWNKRVCDDMKKSLAASNPSMKFDSLPGKRAARIFVENNGFRFKDRDRWNEARKWLCESLDRFRSATEDKV